MVRYGYLFAVAAVLIGSSQLFGCGEEENPGPTNQKPIIDTFSPSPDSGILPLDPVFSWNISDADGDTLTCRLNAGDGSAEYLINNCTSADSQAHSYSALGNFNATLRVVDSKGDFQEQTALVVAHAQPQITAFGANPSSGILPVNTTFSWNISDADGDTLTCRLNAGDGSAEYLINNCTSADSQAHMYIALGNHTATLRVTDSRGEFREQATTVFARINQGPVISEFVVDPPNGQVPLGVKFDWTIADPDGDALLCRVDADGDGTFEYTIDPCTSSSTQLHVFSVVANYAAKLRIEDIYGAYSEKTTAIVAEAVPVNQNPTIDSLAATPISGPAPLTVTFDWTISDVDGDTLTCTIDFEDDATVDLTINNCTSANTTNTYLLVGNSTMRFRVEDPDGALAEDTITVTASLGLPNAPSGLNASTASLSQIDLSWSDNASNEDGYKIERSINGADYEEIASLPADSAAHSDTGLNGYPYYSYRVKAFNNTGFSAFSNIATANTQASDSWLPTQNSGIAAAARYAHTAVWTGSEMLVWGGWAGQAINTGGKYDPATDSWTAITTTNAPSPRASHSAVWTNNEMIVWGGYDAVTPPEPGSPGTAGFLATGGAYDPATDSWSTVTTAGAPSARASHSSVWSGSRLIVWGGWNGSNLANGGIYNPATSAWEANDLSTGAPAGRYFHTVLWTGNEMVVWGGFGSIAGEPLNTGSYYTPASNTWTPITTTSAPEPRYSHSAVWTGDKMIVWGGRNNDSTPVYFSNGGIYDLGGNSWTSTTTTGAPDGRSFHSAVWTGASFVVWGGWDSASYFQSGAKYNPVTDSWSPMSTVNVPYGRARHTGVWTGQRMIVWGGWGCDVSGDCPSGSPSYHSNGGVYKP